LFDVTKDYAKSYSLKGHSSFITAFDWSQDSKYLRSVCGAYELLFWDLNKLKDKKGCRDPSGASNTQKTIWSAQACKLGWSVQGIFPTGCDGSHINTVAMSSNSKLICTGDDYGLVTLFRNPCLAKHQGQAYRGHSEHVTAVEFSDDDAFILSTGGQDQTTI